MPGKLAQPTAQDKNQKESQPACSLQQAPGLFLITQFWNCSTSVWEQKLSEITKLAKENSRLTTPKWLSRRQPHTYLLGLFSPRVLRSALAFSTSTWALVTWAFLASICEEINHSATLTRLFLSLRILPTVVGPIFFWGLQQIELRGSQMLGKLLQMPPLPWPYILIQLR